MSATGPVGIWRLRSYHEVDDEGRTDEGPLGPDPRGLLVYHASGYMSVSMMRTGEARPGAERFMGYAGRWRFGGGEIVHAVEVSAHPFQVGRELIRSAVLTEGELTLEGVSVIGGRPRRRRLEWLRADSADPR